MKHKSNQFVCSQYATATAKDLWQAFQKQLETTNTTNILPSGVNITTVMESWEHQAGIPVVNVTRDYSALTVAITQVLIFM